jgi:hypothetical protein
MIQLYPSVLESENLFFICSLEGLNWVGEHFIKWHIATGSNQTCWQDCTEILYLTKKMLHSEDYFSFLEAELMKGHFFKCASLMEFTYTHHLLKLYYQNH